MLLHLPTTTSTMDEARRLLSENDTTTTIILSDEQTAGRGRHNRPWTTFSAPHSMAATFILRPAAGPHLPLLVALALYHAILPLIPNPQSPVPLIKWPNDILLEGKKLSGILCENLTEPSGQGASLIGIGLNIFPPAEVPDSFQGTFLTSQNPNTPTPRFLAESIWACLNPLITLYGKEGWSEKLHNSYLQHCETIGKNIRWRVPPTDRDPGGTSAETSEMTELTGLARGLTPSGHLEMVAEDGTVHVIHSGEIFDKRS